jgi:hypothetical protein
MKRRQGGMQYGKKIKNHPTALARRHLIFADGLIGSAARATHEKRRGVFLYPSLAPATIERARSDSVRKTMALRASIPLAPDARMRTACRPAYLTDVAGTDLVVPLIST